MLIYIHRVKSIPLSVLYRMVLYSSRVICKILHITFTAESEILTINAIIVS